MRKVYIYNKMLINADALTGVNELLRSKGMPLFNPTIQEVPDNAKIEDFVDEVFSENAYNNRIRLEQQKQYKARVQQLIRQKYSLEDELEMSRTRDNNLDEFQVYYDYVESCIAQAQSEFDR